MTTTHVKNHLKETHKLESLKIQKLILKEIMIVNDIVKEILKIDNEIYLYEMLTTNLLQAMLVRRAEQSHQHSQSSNSALLTR